VAREGESVGSKVWRANTNEYVARSYSMTTQFPAPLNDTHRKTRDVQIIYLHHTTVLSGLATKQRAARLATTLSDTGNDIGDTVGLDSADRDVIEQEQGFSSHTDQIIDTHRDEVNTNRFIAIHKARNF
jgi:hypothetical protein